MSVLGDKDPLRYRYTQFSEAVTNRDGQLSTKQRDFYERNGFIVIPKLIEDEILDACSQHFLDIIHGRKAKGSITMMRDVSLLNGSASADPEMVVNKLQELLYDDVFLRYMAHPKLLDHVENFVGPNIVAKHSMLINKPPDSGKLTSRHPLHQDLYYFPFRPADYVVASWTAMERIDGDNGCLIVVAGSHRADQLYQHDYPQWEGGVNKMYHGVKGFDGATLTELHMEKGDTVFFHPLLVHGSGPNRTQRFRKAISCHYAAATCYDIDVTGTVQELVAKEVSDVAAAKGFSDIKFTDVWQLKSRCVRGLDAKL